MISSFTPVSFRRHSPPKVTVICRPTPLLGQRSFHRWTDKWRVSRWCSQNSHPAATSQCETQWKHPWVETHWQRYKIRKLLLLSLRHWWYILHTFCCSIVTTPFLRIQSTCRYYEAWFLLHINITFQSIICTKATGHQSAWFILYWLRAKDANYELRSIMILSLWGLPHPNNSISSNNNSYKYVLYTRLTECIMCFKLRNPKKLYSKSNSSNISAQYTFTDIWFTRTWTD